MSAHVADADSFRRHPARFSAEFERDTRSDDTLLRTAEATAVALEHPWMKTFRSALHNSQVIDLTTTGRRTGQLRRIEIFLHDDDGLLFITGMPRTDRTRDWIRNIEADPRIVIHLKKTVLADLPATARVITRMSERRPLIEAAARRWGRTDVPTMMQHSPLIVLRVDGDEPETSAQP